MLGRSPSTNTGKCRGRNPSIASQQMIRPMNAMTGASAEGGIRPLMNENSPKSAKSRKTAEFAAV